MPTTVRVLPVEEWDRLTTIGPFAMAGVLPDPLYATVVVEEDTVTGEIVGTWMVTSIMLLEGLWRKEAIRGDNAGAKKLLFGMLNYLKESLVKSAITVIQTDDVRELARKVGFVDISGGGTLHLLTMKDSDPI